MITIKLSCAYCGKEHPEEFNFSEGEFTLSELIHKLSKSDYRWIFERNGPNNDVYCSKECAK